MTSRDPRSIRTVYLGQFEHATAERIAEALEKADIAWHYKIPGRLTTFFFAGDWGVRLYVDSSRIEEVRLLLERLDAGSPGREVHGDEAHGTGDEG